MATEREIELQQKLSTRIEQLERVQNQFKDVSIQYNKASKMWLFYTTVQGLMIASLSSMLVWLAVKDIFHF